MTAATAATYVCQRCGCGLSFSNGRWICECRPLPLSPTVVRETMERFLREQGWRQHKTDPDMWMEPQPDDELIALGVCMLTDAVHVALRRAKEGKS